MDRPVAPRDRAGDWRGSLAGVAMVVLVTAALAAVGFGLAVVMSLTAP